MAKTDNMHTVRMNQNTKSMPTRIPRARQQLTAPELHSTELIEAIEAERCRLMKAQAVLKCALAAMEFESNADAPYYPDVLELAQDIVNQSIDQLDSIKLRPLIAALERGAIGSQEETPEIDPHDDKELRDSANVIYIASTSAVTPSTVVNA